MFFQGFAPGLRHCYMLRTSSPKALDFRAWRNVFPRILRHSAPPVHRRLEGASISSASVYLDDPAFPLFDCPAVYMQRTCRGDAQFRACPCLLSTWLNLLPSRSSARSSPQRLPTRACGECMSTANIKATAPANTCVELRISWFRVSWLKICAFAGSFAADEQSCK